MAKRFIVAIIVAASLLTVGPGRIASGAAKPASTQPSGAATQATQPVELGPLDGAAVLVRIGAVIDGVLLDKLALSADVKAKARQALRTWYVNDVTAAGRRLLPGQPMAHALQIQEAIKKDSIPYRSAQTLRCYTGAKAALKDVLTADQLGKLDALVQAATTDMIANHYILAVVARWKKDKVVLAADQQARLDTILTSAKADAAALAAGDEFGVRKILNRLSGELPRVLTADQRTQVMHPTP
jgi:hypothetical protein